jgi:hypothetical protein
MAQTREDDDRAMGKHERDGWLAVLLVVVIALLSFGYRHGIHLGRWW